MQYHNITINGFRGIKKLTIESLKQVNLLVGKNNCGKTSVLEAIFLLSGLSNAQLPGKINSFRDLPVLSDNDFVYLFYDMNFTQPLLIKANIGKEEERILKLIPTFNTLTNNYDISNGNNRTIESSLSNVESKKIDGLRLESLRSDKELRRKRPYSEIHIDKKVTINVPQLVKEFNCSFLTSRSMFLDLDKNLEKIIIDKKLNDIISVLQEIEPKLIDIKIGVNSIIYADIGLAKLIPLNLMGDGIRRVLSYIVTMYILKDGVLLIDEIENGLHHSSVKSLWKAIFAAAIKFNVQIFVTTHSYECVTACLEITNLEKSKNDLLQLYRLEKKDENTQAINFSYEDLKTSIENNWEIW